MIVVIRKSNKTNCFVFLIVSQFFLFLLCFLVGWLRCDKRENPDVLKHLEEENAYTKAMTNHLESLRTELYTEMLSSIQETDFTLPRPKGDYFTYSRTIQGLSYRIYCRAPRTETLDTSLWDGKKETPILSGEQVTLDINELAKGHSYCSVGTVSYSPTQKYVAYTVDFTGDEKHVLHIKNLETGQLIQHGLELEIYGSIRWGNNDKTIFYLQLDDTNRPYKVCRYTFGTHGSGTSLPLYTEHDESHWTSIYKTLDDKYLMIHTSSSETSEIWYLDLKTTDMTETTKIHCIAKRRQKILYSVDHRNGTFWIESNQDKTPNMCLYITPVEGINCDKPDWTLVKDPITDKPLFDGSYDRALSNVNCFKNMVIAEGREDGMPKVWTIILKSSLSNIVTKFEPLTFAESAHDVGLSSHYEYDTTKIVVAYDSLITPLQHIEIDIMSQEQQRSVLKSKNVPGYQKELYDCDRILVRSRDGKTDIPVCLVYKKDLMEQHLADNKPVHTHMYGYGSYGSCVEADFSATRLPLINRGIVYVLVQVRGGGEMGRKYYILLVGWSFNIFLDVVLKVCARIH